MLEWFSNIKPITYQCYTIQPILNLQTIKLNHFRTIQAILLIKLLNNINIFSQKINTFFHFFQDCFFIGFSTTQAGDKVLAIWDSLHGKLDKKTKFTILCKWNAHPLSLETPETRTVCNRPLMRLSPFALFQNESSCENFHMCFPSRYKSNLFSYQRFCMRTRFETEAQGYSEIDYWNVFFCVLFNVVCIPQAVPSC